MITPEQIIQTVEDHKEEAISCLQEIVQTPSPTGNELAAVSYTHLIPALPINTDDLIFIQGGIRTDEA